jgi:hypothetical protein
MNQGQCSQNCQRNHIDSLLSSDILWMLQKVGPSFNSHWFIDLSESDSFSLRELSISAQKLELFSRHIHSKMSIQARKPSLSKSTSIYCSRVPSDHYDIDMCFLMLHSSTLQVEDLTMSRNYNVKSTMRDIDIERPRGRVFGLNEISNLHLYMCRKVELANSLVRPGTIPRVHKYFAFDKCRLFSVKLFL